LNNPKRQAMHGSKFMNHNPPVFLNGSGDRSHGVVGLLWIGMTQISSGFSLFNGLNDAVNLAYAQALIPTKGLISLRLFPALARAATKFCASIIAKIGWGSGVLSGCTVTDG
jgi:hypothetical protein